MIELLFRENEALSIKMAKDVQKSWIWTEDKLSEEGFNQIDYGQSVEGKIEDVISLPFMLDIGSINVPLDSDYRKNLFLKDTLINGINEADSIERIEQSWKKSLDEFKKLKEYASKGEHFRIWYSDGAYSRCGLYFVCHVLRDYPCKISVIKLPEYVIHSTGLVSIFKSWGEVPYDKLYQFLSLEKELSRAEVQCFTMLWENLKDENSDLRVVVDGKLISASVDFYDTLIRQEISDDEFMVAQVIGKLVVNNQLAVDETWYAKRIKWMIEQGELAIIKEDDRFYNYVLKKNLKKMSL